MKAPHIKTIGRSPLRAFLLIALTLGWLAISPQARAVCQQGCDTSNANTFFGEDVLVNITTGIDNTGIGADALHNNTTGTNNTATGFFALFSNTEGVFNTAIGNNALLSNTTGDINTAIGAAALYSNTTGNGNTASGSSALLSNTRGFNNTANGYAALQFNTDGSSNTATGSNALFSNTTGLSNTADGSRALDNNTTGNFNTATGYFALFSNTGGNRNTAVGLAALSNNTTGNTNTAIGLEALVETQPAAATSLWVIRPGKISRPAITISISAMVVFRSNPGPSASARQEHRQRHFIAGISGATVPTGVAVIVDTHGHLGTITSSARFKDAIKPMDKASEAILALQPVTFRYKHELDPEGIPQFGLVAEQVEKVNPDLVARDEQGKPYTVRYEAVNAMLLNEFLKEHRKVEEQAATEATCARSRRAAAEATIARLDSSPQSTGSANPEGERPA